MTIPRNREISGIAPVHIPDEIGSPTRFAGRNVPQSLKKRDSSLPAGAGPWVCDSRLPCAFGAQTSRSDACGTRDAALLAACYLPSPFAMVKMEDTAPFAVALEMLYLCDFSPSR